MEEYISKNKFQENIKSVINDSTCPIHIAAAIQQYIEEEPVADVTPVVHGKWIKRDGYTECSECEYWYDSPDSEDSGDRSKYCPHCGAKMDLTED